MEPVFKWYPDLGTTVCAIEINNEIIYGVADCHPEDADMMSEKTGCEIAFKRARIGALRHERDCLKERLAALNQLYYSINRSKKFNSKSYENKMLNRQIRFIKEDLATIKEMLTTEEQNLRDYISEKEKFYKKIRENRNKEK